MRDLTVQILWWVAIGSIAYFAALNGLYLVFTGIAWKDVIGHRRRRLYQSEDEFYSSTLTPGVSLLVPAYNEEAGIVESVRSLLALRYPQFEVIIANDGSTDATLEKLREAFDLIPLEKELKQGLEHRPVKAVYISRRDPRLVVLDKENGGKADANNAACAAASLALICAVDADAVLEEQALLQMVRPFLEDERVVAVGGIVRIVNGCEIDHGQVVDVKLPTSWLARIQVVEYFRAFLIGRVAWSRMRSLLIISGAFGMFDRELVESVGGWSTKAIGEDIDLVMCLHKHLRDRGEEYRIKFIPDPVCWTEAPEDFATLARQRRRWQRGLLESLTRYRDMIGNPRYGGVGVFATPYFLVFEAASPLVECLGYILLGPCVALGVLHLDIFLAFLFASVALGALLSLASVALEEVGFRRHRRARDILILVVCSVLENFGYRQWHSFIRLAETAAWARRGKISWGLMKRRGLGQEQASLPYHSSTAEAVRATPLSPYELF